MTAEAFPTPDAWLEHRVSYGETDAMGVMYYAEYLHLFERARSLLIRDHGMSYAQVEEKSVYLPVREAYARYKAPCRYDELVWVRTGISKWGRASVTFEYQVTDQGREKILATGHTQHATVNPDGRPVKVPSWLKDLFT